MNPPFYRAPWSKTLKISSAVVLGVLLIGALISWPVGAIPMVVLIVAGLFLVVTGYSVQQGKVFIHGLLWRKAFDLCDLETIVVEPGITAGSIRTLGSGGLFSSLGYFSNQSLGSYLGFMTDPQNAVVLDFIDRRVVVTPENPQDFRQAVILEYKHIHV